MKIAFWGLGSIAKRHIRNLTEILTDRNEPYQIDIIRHEGGGIRESWLSDLVTHIYLPEDIQDKHYDVIFITNPTALHYETIRTCADHTKNMFIEKPVFDSSAMDISGLGLKKDSVYYVACPLRYTAVLQYVNENIDLNDVIAVRAISSSYLPDWRPGVDYRHTYSANKKLGGGVAIDLIHEWDYLTLLFGYPQQVLYTGGKFSDLEIDSDDLAIYTGIYADKVIELHLDYFGKKTLREMVLFTHDETITVDIANSRIIYETENRVVNLAEERDQYQKRELEHFLDMIQGKCPNDSTVENALTVLKIAKNNWG